ncbi:uncharacterized protein KY384_001106 [Bacidia gigantensis]|uniref:uncharacterized protein n=1 Tax=Bacidia gigantensis TaxID=2732470 RepID=UPI001D05A7B3|nr:uncharacterized protein KY384_001106 [Bacidia gigantensis]KAG8534262.1 hypothetical protein KY384_001106 [Bacidia gigantensis]
MAPAATDSPAAPGVEEIRQPPSGVVKPPRDIQVIIEKTAGFVARNGPVFEDRIREKEKHNPKFSFLSPNDAYAPFYTWRLQEVREGRGTAISAGRAGEAAPAKEQERPKGPSPPPEFHFSARMPNISAQDLEVVRLTALFVAKNGRSWMTNLANRERNFQFDFLRPQHSFHQFFSRLIDQYTILLQASIEGEKAKRARMYQLEQYSNDRFAIMDRAKHRAAWVKWQEEQRQKKEEAAEKEQIEYQQIDWHDFVIVETILFDEADDHAELPPPTSLNDLQSASLEQKAAMSLQPHDRRIEEAMPTSDDYGLYYGQQQQQQQQPLQPSYNMPLPTYDSYDPQQPSIQPAAMPPPNLPPPSFQNPDEDRAIADRARAREQAQAAQAAAKGSTATPMRIREDYVPRAQAKRQAIQTAICPNCHQAIPTTELEQHMKIELLDPRWKEQRQKAESRATTTNLSTSDVAANLKRLASQRSDVFDPVSGQPITPEEEARRKRAAMSGYDGQVDTSMGSANAAAKKAMAAAEAEREKEREGRERGKGASLEEQLRLIHQMAKG